MSEEERHDIINWACSTIFQHNTSNYRNKLEYDMNIFDKKIPMAVWRIKNRIIHRENLYNYSREALGKDVIMIHLQGGQTAPHTDTNIGEYRHIRYNVFIMHPPTGCITHYNNKQMDTIEGHYIMCRSGIDVHSISVNKHPIPRISLSFGFMIPLENIRDNQIVSNKLPSIIKFRDIYFNRDEKDTSSWPAHYLEFFMLLRLAPLLGSEWWTTGKIWPTFIEYLNRK
jgi:hypothetical protein